MQCWAAPTKVALASMGCSHVKPCPTPTDACRQDRVHRERVKHTFVAGNGEVQRVRDRVFGIVFKPANRAVWNEDIHKQIGDDPNAARQNAVR